MSRRKTRVQVHLSPEPIFNSDGGWFEVEGYEVSVLGIPMVAHRSVDVNAGEESKLSIDRWTITEPRTGMSICDGKVEYLLTIRAALRRAEAVIETHGGAKAVDDRVAKRLKRPEFCPPAIEAAA